MTAPTTTQPRPEGPAPDDVISIEPAPIEVEGFPGKTTDKVLLVTYGDGRKVFECAEEKCGVQRDTLHKVLYHRRDHRSRLRVVPAQPTEQAVSQAVEQIEQAREAVAVTDAEQAVVEQVIEGAARTGTVEVLVAEPEPTPAESVDADEVLAQAKQIVDTITALTATIERLQESHDKSLAALRQAEKHRDEAESDVSEWRRRAHAAEAVINEIRQIRGIAAA